MKKYRVIGLVATAILALHAAAAHAAAPGGSAETAARSAKYIQQASPSAASGVYWFDPDGSGSDAPFATYADMTTAGGGWMLGLHSVKGSESATTDMVANTGEAMPSLSTGFTRDMSYWAIDQNAQIRHRITSTTGTVLFDGYYTGSYHGTMAAADQWTVITGSLAAVGLATHAGKDWSTAADDRDDAVGNCASVYRQSWYYGACWGVLPTGYPGMSGPQLFNGTFLGSYDIYVRELATPTTPVPEPETWAMAVAGLAVAFRLLRRG